MNIDYDYSSEPCISVTGLFIAIKEFTVRLNWADDGYWKTAYQQGHINEYLSTIINGGKGEREKKKMTKFL